jgi:hypothetical protein
VVAACALLVAWRTYNSNAAEARNKFAADAVVEWNRHQAVNTRQCLALMGNLDPGAWDKIFNRRAIVVPEDQRDQIVACLSDKSDDEIGKLFKRQQGELTTLGVAALANRVNEILGADNVIAGFVIGGLGNLAVLAPIATAICRDDRKIVAKLDQSKNLRTSFGAIRALLASPPETVVCPKE